MLLVVNCWLFDGNRYCIARDAAGALQCAFSVVERRKKSYLNHHMLLARTGDAFFLRSLLVKLVWKTNLDRTQLPAFGFYSCREEKRLSPAFLSRYTNSACRSA